MRWLWEDFMASRYAFLIIAYAVKVVFFKLPALNLVPLPKCEFEENLDAESASAKLLRFLK
jgi:hypothetical protein